MNEELKKELYEYLNKAFEGIVIGGKPLNINDGICYTVSWTATRILKKLGYNCRPQRIGFIIGDSIGRNLYEESDGKVSSQEVIDAGGWIIGLGVTSKAKDVETNHWVVFFPDEDEILDLTIGQASRPEKGIILEPFWTKADELPEPIFRAGFIDNIRQSHQIKNVPEVKLYLKKVIKDFNFKKGVKQ